MVSWKSDDADDNSDRIRKLYRHGDGLGLQFGNGRSSHGNGESGTFDTYYFSIRSDELLYRGQRHLDEFERHQQYLESWRSNDAVDHGISFRFLHGPSQ